MNDSMKALTYDNPATMQRECWYDGKLLCAYSASLLCGKYEIPERFFFFGANIGPWKAGQHFGDLDAMPLPELPTDKE